MHRAKQRDLNDTFSSQEAHITSSVRAIELVKLDRYVSLRNGVEARDASIFKIIGRQTGGRTFRIQVLEITVAIATQNLKETLGLLRAGSGDPDWELQVPLLPPSGQHRPVGLERLRLWRPLRLRMMP